jgi:hypothetical protein
MNGFPYDEPDQAPKSTLRQRAREVADRAQEAARQAAERVPDDVKVALGATARAAIEGATEDLRGKDGEIKKRKVLRRALRPTKSARRAATAAAKSASRVGRRETRQIAEERAIAALSGASVPSDPELDSIWDHEESTSAPMHSDPELDSIWDDTEVAPNAASSPDDWDWEAPAMPASADTDDDWYKDLDDLGGSPAPSDRSTQGSDKEPYVPDF